MILRHRMLSKKRVHGKNAGLFYVCDGMILLLSISIVSIIMLI